MNNVVLGKQVRAVWIEHYKKLQKLRKISQNLNSLFHRKHRRTQGGGFRGQNPFLKNDV